MRCEVAMKLSAIVALFAALLFPATLCAQPVYLFGQIGRSAVMASLDRNGDALTGWYVYMDVGKQLLLTGRIDAAGGFGLDATAGGRKTGRFEGKTVGGRWTGAWRGSAGGAPLAFTLAETRDTLAEASGRYRCATKRKDKSGWTYEHSLAVEIAHGAVQALDASLAESSATDGQQGCFYALGDFTQVPAEAGILLRAKDEDHPLTADSQRCTIRIVGDADHLFVRFGDSGEKNDDCRFSGTTAFCSPRSWMADMIVDRRTNRCKSVGD
jgi:hypothetical protein